MDMGLAWLTTKSSVPGLASSWRLCLSSAQRLHAQCFDQMRCISSCCTHTSSACAQPSCADGVLYKVLEAIVCSCHSSGHAPPKSLHVNGMHTKCMQGKLLRDRQAGGHTHQGDVLRLRHQEHDEEGHEDHPAREEEEDAELFPTRYKPESAVERYRQATGYCWHSKQPWGEATDTIPWTVICKSRAGTQAAHEVGGVFVKKCSP